MQKKKAKATKSKAKKPEVRQLAPGDLAKVSGGVTVDLTCHTIDNDPNAGLGFPAHPDPEQYRPQCLSGFTPTMPTKFPIGKK
jgi:hypothetical protein